MRRPSRGRGDVADRNASMGRCTTPYFTRSSATRVQVDRQREAVPRVVPVGEAWRVHPHHGPAGPPRPRSAGDGRRLDVVLQRRVGPSSPAMMPMLALGAHDPRWCLPQLHGTPAHTQSPVSRSLRPAHHGDRASILQHGIRCCWSAPTTRRRTRACRSHHADAGRATRGFGHHVSVASTMSPRGPACGPCASPAEHLRWGPRAPAALCETCARHLGATCTTALIAACLSARRGR